MRQLSEPATVYFQKIGEIISLLEKESPTPERQTVQCYLNLLVSEIAQLKEEQEPQSSEVLRNIRFRLMRLGSQSYLLK
jgi:hypothetical protein